MAQDNSSSSQPPVAKKKPKELTIHGHTRIDNYYWLNQRQDPEVIAYLKAENEYTEKMLKHTEELQENLFQEIIGRIKQDDESVPYQLRGYFYYTRYEEGKEYPIYCRKKGSLEAQEQVILDVNKMAEGKAFYQVVGLTVSPNNQMIAFGVDDVGRRKYTIHFKDLTTGEILAENIQNTTGSSAWANDNNTVFYSVRDATLRPYKIFRYTLGEAKRVEVYHESDPTYLCYVFRSKSGQYLFVGSYSTLSHEYRFVNADHPKEQLQVIQPRERKLEYFVDHFQDHFYIVTNHQAKNFKLVKTPIDKTTKENWQEVIAHRKDTLLENIEIFRNYLVVEERTQGLTQLRVISWDGDKDYYISFPEETYLSYIGTNPEFDSDTLRYGYTSLTTPNSVYDYNMNTQEQVLRKRQEVVGGYNPEEYQAKRLYATAKDGTQVPISLVYKKSLKQEQGNPLLLYGYGSYGHSLDPYFSSVRLSLLNRGFVFAIAHIRGGQEMGRYWYEQGKLLNKKNTFHDFIACGEHLLKKNYAKEDQLFAAGGSAGGLLIGAVVNMRPDLFKGVIASVPFVDVVTTMLDESIPLTTGEYDEWGNPNQKEYYQYILSYSPYDNVEAKDYPAMLITTGLHDSQVQYWEPAKWVAKLRDLKTDNNLLLLKTDMSSGHGGASGRFKRHRETALEYAFLLELAGKNE